MQLMHTEDVEKMPIYCAFDYANPLHLLALFSTLSELQGRESNCESLSTGPNL